MTNDRPLSFWSLALRGALGRCPRCGDGRLFASYVKQVEHCAVCGEALGHIRADDGPAWLTILLVGHILAPFILAFGQHSDWPDQVAMIVWPAIALLLALLILPRAKGIFIAAIWRSGCVGAQK